MMSYPQLFHMSYTFMAMMGSFRAAIVENWK